MFMQIQSRVRFIGGYFSWSCANEPYYNYRNLFNTFANITKPFQMFCYAYCLQMNILHLYFGTRKKNQPNGETQHNKYDSFPSLSRTVCEFVSFPSDLVYIMFASNQTLSSAFGFYSNVLTLPNLFIIYHTRQTITEKLFIGIVKLKAVYSATAFFPLILTYKNKPAME